MSKINKLLTIDSIAPSNLSCDEEDEIAISSDPILVYDAESLNAKVPAGFNAVKISIDASVKGDLRWEEERDAATAYIEQGFKIFWDLRFGLFSNLLLPLENQTQFLSFCLSLEHFRESLLKEFSCHTAGVCLYRGMADFQEQLSWQDNQCKQLQDWLLEIFGNVEAFNFEMELSISDFSDVDPTLLSSSIEGKKLFTLYSEGVALDYLELLADRLPDTVSCFVFVNVEAITDTLLQVQLATKERFHKIDVRTLGLPEWVQTLSLDSTSISLCQSLEAMSFSDACTPSNIGLCLPSKLVHCPSKWIVLRNSLKQMLQKKIHFRVIPEELLTTEWDGLDYLIVSSKILSIEGRRKLQGFSAAGGVVVSLDDPIGLFEEVSFPTFILDEF